MNQDLNPWAKIPLDIISKLSFAPVDLYVRLSDIKYVKVYAKNDMVLNELASSYSLKQVAVFYCRRLDYAAFVEYCTRKNITVTSSENIELIQELVLLLGISEFVKKQIDDVVHQIQKEMLSTKKLGLFLNQVLGKEDYLSQHSTCLSYVSCVMANKMDWPSHLVLEKLVYVSILHDLFLSSAILLKLKKSNGDISTLTWKEQKQYLHHIASAVNLVEESKNIPSDIADIIANHHEYTDDLHFPTGKSPLAIPQIAALFILADQFCHQIHFEDGIKMKPFLENWEYFHRHYNVGNFKKPLGCLKELIKGHFDGENAF